MKASDRNESVKLYIASKLDRVTDLTEDYFTTLSNYDQLSGLLSDLINVKAMGFRGIVATAIAGKYLNPSYDPLNNFYSCNPRAIFENGIFYAFDGKVPCGKSDPLNVAKNINVLDEEWANGKRPQKAALAAVKYLRIIEGASKEEKEILIDLFFFKLSEYSKSVGAIEINISEIDKLSHQGIARKLTRFVLEYPESGTIPQLAISKLLNKLYEVSEISVMGGDESVFGTNTTSKKPADIWLEIDSSPTHLYEITVKKIDNKRLDDSIQSINSLGLLNRTIYFICRLPEDVSELSGALDETFNYKGKNFNFIDISQFITSVVALLAREQLDSLLEELKEFVEKIDRPVKTKKGWNSIF